MKIHNPCSSHHPLRYATVGALVLAAASGASAATLINDNFDGYADQAAFLAAWPLSTVANSGVLTSAQFVSSPNSVSYDTTGTQRNQRTFTETGTPSQGNLITFSFDFYDSNAGASPYRQYASIQDSAAGSGNGQLIAMGLNNNQTSANNGGNYYMARIVGYNPNETGATAAGNFFKLNGANAPLRSTGWHNLSVTISDTEFNFYVDGILSETVVNALTLRSYELVRLGGGVSSTTASGFDNVMVSTAAVPEPGTWALLGLGGLAFLWRRRA